MTETVKIPTKEELLEPQDQEILDEQIAPEVNPEEQRAMDDGWVPKDQWKGNSDDWRPAKEFNDRGELFSRIKTQSRELQELKQGMEFLTKEAKKQYDLGVKNTIDELRQARRAALEDGNMVAAEEFRDKIDEVKEEAAKARTAPPPPAGPSPTFEKWHANNSWYMKDDDVTAVADRKGLKFKKENPNSSEADMLAYVAEEVKKVFPTKFNKSPPSPSGNGRESPRGRSGEGASRHTETENSMTEEQRGIMRTILKTTGMTKEDYLKQYAS